MSSPPRPLKLILKVSGSNSSTTTYQQVTSPATSHIAHHETLGEEQQHQTIPPLNINLKKKKKKKKHKHKHKHHHHHHHHHHHQQHHHHEPKLEQQPNKHLDDLDQLQQPLEQQLDQEAQQPGPPQLDINELIDHSEQLPELDQKTQPEPPELDLSEIIDEPMQLEQQPEETLDKSLHETDTLSQQQAPPDTIEIFKTKPITDIRKNGVHLSFLRLKPDSSTSLAILGTNLCAEEEEKQQTSDGDYQEKIINLETLCGKLTDGLEVLPTQIEDELEDSKIKMVETVESTAYSSYLPSKDSTFANLSEEDSKILLTVYGNDPVGFDYARSLQDFAQGTDYVMNMVDSLLDLLTNGKHRQEAVPIRERLIENSDAVRENSNDVMENGDDVRENGEEVRENGDVEMLTTEDTVQNELDEIGKLLDELKALQNKKLSSSAAPLKPSEKEATIANMISSKLTKFIGEFASPNDICESSAIHKALGIKIEPDPTITIN